jgi:hypothetical protein
MRSASDIVLAALRRCAWPLAAALLGAGLAAEARAEDLYVICHPTVSLAAGDLRDVFLGEKQFAGPVKLSPADNDAAHEAFLEKVLKMDAARYRTAWTKKSFRDGVNPPVVRNGDRETLEYVKRAPGRCSYVMTAPGPGVLVVARF